jgi:hypothetical protein
LASATALVDASSSSPSTEEREEIVERVLDMLLQFSRHRHRGSDFVWEAYDVEIGGPG